MKWRANLPELDSFPVGGGRPCNGGINTGCGVIVISSFALDRIPNFQSTLQHELGHGFGLPHVDVYRYDMKKNPSIMAYNTSHKTKGLQPSKTPGILIPEDIRALALNKRAFPKLKFDAARDIPAGYSIARRIVWLGPMEITGQPSGVVQATTASGELNNSSVSKIVQGRIEPSHGPGITFNPRSMWVGDATTTGWVSAEITFPLPVRLSRVGIHSQHSGKYHAAIAVRIEAKLGNAYREVAERKLGSVDDHVSFRLRTARQWRLYFQAGKSKRVVIRGLQFFSGKKEVFPPFVPYTAPDAAGSKRKAG